MQNIIKVYAYDTKDIYIDLLSSSLSLFLSFQYNLMIEVVEIDIRTLQVEDIATIE